MSISKIVKVPCLRPLALKSNFLQQFEFSEHLEISGMPWKILKESKVLLSNNFFQTNLITENSLKIQAVMKFHSLMPGASKLGYFDICDTLVPFLVFFKL